MNKKHSRIALIISLVVHASLFTTIMVLLSWHKSEHPAEQESMSMEMVAALLEQPAVAVAPDASTEEVKEVEEAKPEPEPEAVPDPVVKPKPEKPKEKPKEEKRKERPKPPKEEKPKDKPKEQEQKPIKAVEKGPEVKQGIVAKAISGAAEGEKVNAGVVGGQKNGSANSTSTGASGTVGGNPDEHAAYKAALQKALQRKANNSYPQREKMMRKMGTVTIKFNISPSGQVTSVSVINSSGNSNLDAAAVKSAEGMQAPPPPAGFPSSVTAPVKFSIE